MFLVQNRLFFRGQENRRNVSGILPELTGHELDTPAARDSRARSTETIPPGTTVRNCNDCIVFPLFNGSRKIFSHPQEGAIAPPVDVEKTLLSSTVIRDNNG